MISKLDDTGKGNPFRIPENFFEDVNRKIISSLPENEAVKAGIFIRLKPVLKLAAFISGFILASYLIIKILNPPANQQFDNEITLNEFSESYLNDIEFAVTDEEEAVIMIPEVVPDVSNSELIDYLIMENINTDEIYEQL
jgi:hypothetical protein